MVKVKKADGSLEDFNENKVRSSLLRAGADQKLIEDVLHHVEKELFEGITTDAIYAHIFELLKNSKHPVSIRYNLKRAIMELGPSGYPFEKFFAGVLREYGYKTLLNQIVKGRCIEHEIDIVAEMGNKKIAIECKFHNRSGTKSDVRNALYTYARYLDTRDVNDISESWLVTNTKATTEAISYARCVGISIISWNYPEGFSLRELVEKSGLHPITALESLDNEKKQRYFDEGIVFIKDIPEKERTII
jgi:hypothetical protein